MTKVWNALARIVLAVPLIVFGLNGFLRVIPVPKMTPEGEAFIRALVETGYMLPFWKGTEVVCGIMILTGLWQPLALVVITPVMLNIIAFHLWLEPNPATMGLVALMTAGLVRLTIKNWSLYRPMLSRKPARNP